MKNYRFALIFALGLGSLAGCRACGTCYDYSSPVANCACSSCGHGRAGSNISGGTVAGDEVIYEESQPQMMMPPEN